MTCAGRASVTRLSLESTVLTERSATQGSRSCHPPYTKVWSRQTNRKQASSYGAAGNGAGLHDGVGFLSEKMQNSGVGGIDRVALEHTEHH